MVLRLGAALGVPLRERNDLLNAAGLPAAFPEAAMDAADLTPFRAAIETLLAAHLPYPAMVLDRHWNVLFANAACTRLYGAELVGANIVRRYLGDPAALESIVNWADIAWASVDRLREQQDRAPFDEELRELAALAETALAALPRPDAPGTSPTVCPWFRVGDQVIKTIGVVARFDTATEVTLDELRIELAYPLDHIAERFFRQQAE